MLSIIYYTKLLSDTMYVCRCVRYVKKNINIKGEKEKKRVISMTRKDKIYGLRLENTRISRSGGERFLENKNRPINRKGRFLQGRNHLLPPNGRFQGP